MWLGYLLTVKKMFHVEHFRSTDILDINLSLPNAWKGIIYIISTLCLMICRYEHIIGLFEGMIEVILHYYPSVC